MLGLIRKMNLPTVVLISRTKICHIRRDGAALIYLLGSTYTGDLSRLDIHSAN